MKFRKVFQKKELRTHIPRNQNPFAESIDSRHPKAGAACNHKMVGLTPRTVASMTPRAFAALTPMALSLLSPTTQFLQQQHKDLVEAFRIIDANHDGQISRKELKEMWKNLRQKVSDKEVRLMIKDVDEDGDGQINLKEFVNLHRKFGTGIDDHEHFRRELHRVFAMVDADGDGRVSAQELVAVMRKLGTNCTIQEAHAMLKLVGKRRNDLIDLHQFERLMSSGRFAKTHAI